MNLPGPYRQRLIERFGEDVELLHAWPLPKSVYACVVLAAGMLFFVTLLPDSLLIEGSFTRLEDVKLRG